MKACSRLLISILYFYKPVFHQMFLFLFCILVISRMLVMSSVCVRLLLGPFFPLFLFGKNGQLPGDGPHAPPPSARRPPPRVDGLRRLPSVFLGPWCTWPATHFRLWISEWVGAITAQQGERSTKLSINITTNYFCSSSFCQNCLKQCVNSY